MSAAASPLLPTSQLTFFPVVDCCLSRWDVAAHNSSIRFQHRLAGMEWDRVSNGEQAPPVPGTPNTDRTIHAASLPENARTFQWPHTGGELYVVFCTKPDCPLQAFTKHPLRRARALSHFQTHGLYMEEDAQVIQRFGFKGPSKHPSSRSASADSAQFSTKARANWTA